MCEYALGGEEWNKDDVNKADSKCLWVLIKGLLIGSEAIGRGWSCRWWAGLVENIANVSGRQNYKKKKKKANLTVWKIKMWNTGLGFYSVAKEVEALIAWI